MYSEDTLGCMKLCAHSFVLNALFLFLLFVRVSPVEAGGVFSFCEMPWDSELLSAV